MIKSSMGDLTVLTSTVEVINKRSMDVVEKKINTDKS